MREAKGSLPFGMVLPPNIVIFTFVALIGSC
jgi:hypothetical protein